MCGNTRPKLLEVSYGKTSQHNKGLSSTNSPHFTEYCTNEKHARLGGFKILDAEHRTDSRHPLDQPPDTTTETDDERRRRRRAKTETDEDGLNLGTSDVAAPLQLKTPRSDDDGT